MVERAVLSWSGGKDSALCLADKTQVEIVGLLTTVTRDYDRISMHGVRTELLRKQASELGLPLHIAYIPKASSNVIYEEVMKASLQSLKTDQGLSTVAFGDLFLQDIRQYREKFLQGLGMNAAFPLWGRDTTRLASHFIEKGFKAKICCLDPEKLDEKFCGREYDETFLSEIPREVDPCGENGEFHTFVYGGPIFKEPIKIRTGEIVHRDGFWFADLLPS